MAGRRLALLVATSSYDDAAFGRLRAPEADIEALRDVLADPVIGGYQVEVLSNAASHEVNQAIDEFFTEAKLDDLVLLYFSGHGFKNDEGRLYLITRESRQRRLDSTAVSAQFVRDKLDRCRSRRKVVILDCCYAGAFPAGATKGADHVDVLGGLSGQGCAVITASSALEYAFEEDGNSSQVSEAEPSVFSGALIDGLATGNADINGDGLVAIDELYNHVFKHVKDRVSQQTPGWNSQIEGILYVATSPRGPQPTPLPPELIQAIKSPLRSTRFGVVEELLEFCEGAHPGTLITVHAALSELAEDDSAKVSRAAKSALATISERLADGASDVARGRADLAGFAVSADAARIEAARIIDDARREADQLLSAAGLDVARLRLNAERDSDAMLEAAKEERDKILATAGQQAEEMRARAQEMTAQAGRMQEEADAFLLDTKAQAAGADAEIERRLAAFETELARRREEAERLENERIAATVKLESEAEKRATAAEQRAAAASARADQVGQVAQAQARELIANAQKQAEKILAQARAFLDQSKVKAARAEAAQSERRADADGQWLDEAPEVYDETRGLEQASPDENRAEAAVADPVGEARRDPVADAGKKALDEILAQQQASPDESGTEAAQADEEYWSSLTPFQQVAVRSALADERNKSTDQPFAAPGDESKARTTPAEADSVPISAYFEDPVPDQDAESSGHGRRWRWWWQIE